MTIAISYLLYNWSLQQARNVSQEIEKTADPMVCDELGFSVESICQNMKTLNFNVTNTNNMDITGFIIKSVGLYPEDNDYLSTSTVDFKVAPGDTERIKVLKKMTLSQVEITPFATRNGKEIYCETQSIKKEKKDLIQC
jgi:hypothetical protein